MFIDDVSMKISPHSIELIERKVTMSNLVTIVLKREIMFEHRHSTIMKLIALHMADHGCCSILILKKQHVCHAFDLHDFIDNHFFDYVRRIYR